MRAALVAAAFVAVGLLHLVPAVGVLGPTLLATLYDVAPPEGDLLLMLRHRAALFGVLGLLLLAAAWEREWRTPVGVFALASMLAFIALAWPVDGATAAVARVFWADVVASAALASALVAERWQREPARHGRARVST